MYAPRITTDPSKVAAYRKARGDGHPAHVAFRIATAGEPRYPITDERNEFIDSATGFRLVFTVKPDYDASPHDWLGRFTDDWTPGAYENPDACWHMDAYGQRVQGNRRVYGYFVPEQTEQDIYESLRRFKYGKASARDRARKASRHDARLAFEYESYGLTCEVFIGNTLLGTSGLWGIDCIAGDLDMTYLSDVAADLAHEVIDEAKDVACDIRNAAACLDCDDDDGPDAWTTHTPAVPWMVGMDSLGTPYGPRCPAGCLADGVVTASRPAAIRCACPRCDVEWTETIITEMDD